MIIRRPKLTKPQYNRLSEIFDNIAVAWFSAGVISPLFIHSENLFAFIGTFGLSLVLAVAFLLFSLLLVRGTKL
jgi:hypothetical protein